VAWLVILGGLSSGRPREGRLRWIAPGILRPAEYAGLSWIALNDSRAAAPAALALVAVLTFRHYDVVYRLRNQGFPPPGWLGVLAGGWDGRLILGVVLLAAGALPAGFFVLAGVLAAVLAIESVVSWRAFSRAGHTTGEYDDEEDGVQ
jgi:hypothetical protein